MIINKIQDEYFNWMFQLVNAPDQYSYLLMHLDKIPFKYTLLRDGNREADGIDLRYRFGQECGYDNRLIASHLDVRPCTVLEMMTALALRCEEHIMNDPEIGDRTCVWFWKMIDSLGLHDETNDRFDEAHVDEIIDIATLTGACMVALGTVASGIMGNDDKKIKEFIASSDEVGERFWQMPMYEEYGNSLKSDIADTKNTGGRMGGTSAAAIFLSHFVKKAAWLHLDIAGTAFLDSPNAEGIKGATGIGIRSLIKYIAG